FLFSSNSVTTAAAAPPPDLRLTEDALISTAANLLPDLRHRRPREGAILALDSEKLPTDEETRIIYILLHSFAIMQRCSMEMQLADSSRSTFKTSSSTRFMRCLI
ncbi:unnamed protein product, partial [Urochloa humidicola]